MARSSRPDPASRLRSSRRAHRRIRQRRYPAVIEHHRRGANDDARAGFAVAKAVLDCRIDSAAVIAKARLTRARGLALIMSRI
jgi:hypothetical protein